jgi:type I restriction enzyme M protein
MAAVYRQFKTKGSPETVPGFCRVAPIDEVRGQLWALTPGRYVGTEEGPNEDEAFEDKFLKLIRQLQRQFSQGHALEELISTQLAGVDGEI